MKLSAFYGMRKARRERVLCRCAGMRAAKERKRLDRAKECEGWKRVGTFLVVVHAGPDGRTMAIQAHGCDTWTRCGSERAVRGALARMLWERRERGSLNG